MIRNRLHRVSRVLKNEEPLDSVGHSIATKDEKARAYDILYEAQQYYLGMETFRRDRERNKKYTYGKQWDDVICVDGKRIKEEDYIKSQGNVALKNNHIRRMVRRLLGEFRKLAFEPLCCSRDRDEQEDGEIMKASTYGMFPNMGVDAWTIAIGAHGVYRTNKAKYLRWGMSEADAERRAIQDAELNFNKSQQSSEGAFLAPIQVDHTFYATSAMLFRNASTSYSREAHNSARNLKRMISGEANVEFMAKQWLRTMGKPEEEWTDADWEEARKFAKEDMRRAAIKNAVNLGIYGWILPWLWRIGGIAPLLLLSSDDDEKTKQQEDALKSSAFAPLEGLSYGDVVTDALSMLVGLNEKEITQLGRSNPMISDVVQTLKHLDKDWVRGLNDVLNIIGGMCTGVNPQTLTDWVAAIMDATDDRNTQKETALLVARLLNCPQSQLDKIYFEELNMTGTEASQLTPMEVAERYAEYKMFREAPLTGWMRSEEATDSIKTAKINRVVKDAKTRIEGRTQTEQVRALLDEYDVVSKRERELSALKKTDRDAYREGRIALRQEHDQRVHNRVKRYKRDMNELYTRYINANTPEEAQEAVNLMITTRDKLLEDVEGYSVQQ